LEDVDFKVKLRKKISPLSKYHSKHFCKAFGKCYRIDQQMLYRRAEIVSME